MFRFFRRGKKKKKEKQEDKDIVKKEHSVTKTEEKTTSEIEKGIKIPEYTTGESTFEERFAALPKVVSESIPDEVTRPKAEHRLLPFIEKVYDLEDTPHGFVSPEALEKVSQESNETKSTIKTIYSTENLPPISLEEKIEGALFAVGRPIHTSELIEFLQEESPVVKRALRRVQRKRKRTSPIILTEISKDRWVLQLNPIYHEYFRLLAPEKFLSEEHRRVLTEIAYRQPISIALVKKMVRKIGPIKITAICKDLEERGYIVGEKRSRSLVYTTTPKFAKDFGFDNESRRLKLQMLWRLKRLMGDYEVEEEEEEETEELSGQKTSSEKVETSNTKAQVEPIEESLSNTHIDTKDTEMEHQTTTEDDNHLLQEKEE